MAPAKAPPKFRRASVAERREELIEAGLACLAQGGIPGFTIDRICAEAQVSRGLITHHFKSKDGLLAAIYERMIGQLLANVEGEDDITVILERSFSPPAQDPANLAIWLALWGEISTNERLLNVHRRQYARYRAGLESALSALAKKNRRKVDTRFMATALVSLIDGLWLERTIDPKRITVSEALLACKILIEPVFRPLQRSS